MRKRAPKGYRIEQWEDGSFHIYRQSDGACIGEEYSRIDAIIKAEGDKTYRKLHPYPEQTLFPKEV